MNQIYIHGLFLILLPILIPNLAFASPVVPHQELPVPTGFTNKIDGQSTTGYDSLDFQTVTYVSDGNFLNATFFLPEKFNPNNTRITTYGMLIGIDAKSGNGQGGINFIYSQTLDNDKWIVNYQQITSSGHTATFYKTIEPYDGQINQDDFINLSLDLRKLGSPNYYDIIFFSTGEVDQSQFHVTNGPPIASKVIKGSSLVFIPPLSISMETIPSPLMLLPGDHKDITLRFKTNTNLNLPVMIQVPPQSKNGITVNEFNQFQNYTFSDGQVDIPVEVSVPDNAKTSLQNFPVQIFESFNRNASINGESVDNELIKATLFTTEPLNKQLELEIPVGTKPEVDWSVYAPWIAVFVTAVGIGATSILTVKSNRLTRKEIKAKVRPILARTEMGQSAFEDGVSELAQSDHALTCEKALFHFANVGELPAKNIKKKWDIGIMKEDHFSEVMCSKDYEVGINMPDMAPNEKYSIDIEWNSLYYNESTTSSNCYFRLVLEYEDYEKNKYHYNIEGHFFGGGYVYIDSANIT